jgi:hypothetical protein
MQPKIILLSLATTLLCGTLNAQDKIHKKDGGVIDARVKNVGSKTITYARADNQSGPEYTILKNDVQRIQYEAGNEDNFDAKAQQEVGEGRPKEKYGRNLVSLAPLQFTDNGLGFSLSYEAGA